MEETNYQRISHATREENPASSKLYEAHTQFD